jgi:putative nucleotidyltransferase with HDIG domain
MDRLAVISDSVDDAASIGGQLVGHFQTQCFHRHDIAPAKPGEYTIVDIDLANSSNLFGLGQWLKRGPQNRKVIFAVDRGIRHQAVQAYAIGATDLVPRPIDRNMLLEKLLGVAAPLSELPAACAENPDGISAGVAALEELFAAARSGAAPELRSVETCGETIVGHIKAGGLAPWVETVRKHHSQTYQHCLLVTGVAVTFGRSLGFSATDQHKLAVAGLLHDIGKAKIPLAILEKPGRLDADEIVVMKRHPLLGLEALQDARGLDSKMLDMVVHHHEYLDGSGYPHGLGAGAISDLVRIMTIADVFGALIERRTYKPPLPAEAAYGILGDMGPKLDGDLVREFRAVVDAQASREAPVTSARNP